MKRMLLMVPILCGFFGCGEDVPTSEDSCAYDGYRFITFSTSGLATKDEFFDKSNTSLLYYTFNYNANDDITSMVVHNPTGTNIGYIISTLNAAGNSDVDSLLDQDSVMFGYEMYAYDPSNQLTTASYYSADNSLQYIYRYYYDSSNRMSYMEKYDAANILLEKTTNERSSNGLLSRATTTDPNGVKTGYRDYTYGTTAYFMKITYYDCTGGTAKIAREVNPSMFMDKRIRIISGEAVEY